MPDLVVENQLCLKALQEDDLASLKLYLEGGLKVDDKIEDQALIQIAFHSQSYHCTLELIRQGADIMHIDFSHRERYRRLAFDIQPTSEASGNASCSTVTDDASMAIASCSTATDDASTAIASCSTAPDDASTAIASCSTVTDDASTAIASCSTATDGALTVIASCSTVTDDASTAIASCSTATDDASTAIASCSTVADDAWTVIASCSTVTDDLTTIASCSTATDDASTVVASGSTTTDDALKAIVFYSAATDDASTAISSGSKPTDDVQNKNGTVSTETGKGGLRGWFRRLKTKFSRSKSETKPRVDEEAVQYSKMKEIFYQDVIEALENEDVEKVQSYLDDGMEVDEMIRGRETSLMIAAKAASIGCVVEVITRGAKIYHLDSSYKELFQMSAMDNHRALSEALLVHWRISEEPSQNVTGILDEPALQRLPLPINVELEKIRNWLLRLRAKSMMPKATTEPLTEIVPKESLEATNDRTSESLRHEVQSSYCAEELSGLGQLVQVSIHKPADSPAKMSTTEEKIELKMIKKPEPESVPRPSSSISRTSEAEVATPF